MLTQKNLNTIGRYAEGRYEHLLKAYLKKLGFTCDYYRETEARFTSGYLYRVEVVWKKHNNGDVIPSVFFEKANPLGVNYHWQVLATHMLPAE